MDQTIKEELLKILEAWGRYNNHPPWTECIELVKKINGMASEYKRKKDLILMRSFYPEDDDDFDEFEYIHQECVIFTGPHEKIEELAPAVPTWIFRPGGKNEDDKISVWFIGTQKRFFPFPNRKGLKRAHSLLKRWTAEKGHIRVKNMEELTKDRLSFWRSWKGALRQLKAAAAGDSDFEEVATHLEKSVHFGTWCYYEPGTQVINWILE